MSNRPHKKVLKIFFMMRTLGLGLNMNMKTFQLRAFVVGLVVEQNSTVAAILHIYSAFLAFKSTFEFIVSFHM